MTNKCTLRRNEGIRVHRRPFANIRALVSPGLVANRPGPLPEGPNEKARGWTRHLFQVPLWTRGRTSPLGLDNRSASFSRSYELRDEDYLHLEIVTCMLSPLPRP